jgi:hypothetical protein
MIFVSSFFSTHIWSFKLNFLEYDITYHNTFLEKKEILSLF